jgi:hypothetical protein
MKKSKHLRKFKRGIRIVVSFRTNSGMLRVIDSIHDDPTNPKSMSSYILLKEKLKNEEHKDIMDKFLSNKIDDEKTVITINNMKFLKDRKLELGHLYCEYCGKGPLKIYELNFDKMAKNPNMKLNGAFKWFNRINGATCDHKVPKSAGGDKFDYSNLAVCCSFCNERKGSMSWQDWKKEINLV